MFIAGLLTDYDTTSRSFATKSYYLLWKKSTLTKYLYTKIVYAQYLEREKVLIEYITNGTSA